MYFGSVRFFKHLLVGIVFTIIGVLAVLCVLLSVENGKKNDEIEKANEQTQMLEELVEYYSGSKTLTIQELHEIAHDLEISDEELINYLYERDPALFAKLISKWNSSSIPDITEDNDTETSPADSTQNPEQTPSENQPITYTDDKNVVYLTFDSGPSEYTEKLLEILDRKNVKATFFITPDESQECADLMNKIVEAGHAIGVNSYSEDYGVVYADVESFVNDFNTAKGLILDATGIDCKIFRFLGGSVNDLNAKVRDDIIKRMTSDGYVYFDWNVDSGDWLGANYTTMYNNVLANVAEEERAVILFHDGNLNTTLVLEDIINALEADARGFTFRTITSDVKPLQF